MNTQQPAHYYSASLKKKLSLLASSSAIIIEAPSGYGKTTAVRDYLETEQANSNTFWITAIDEAPTSLYKRFCAEISKIDEKAGKCLEELGFPNSFTIGSICETLRCLDCESESWLVIDNFHLLCATLPPAFLVALIEHKAKKLHLVIITQMLGRAYFQAIIGHNYFFISSSDLALTKNDIRRYFACAQIHLTEKEAHELSVLTEGWIIAVYLQLCAFQETGSFSNTTLHNLMEQLLWDKLSGEQQDFLMRLSPFESLTIEQMCIIEGTTPLPAYARDCLHELSPFIRHDPSHKRFEPHGYLLDLLVQKRRERGFLFEQECSKRAGNLCRSERRMAEALSFFAKTDDYESILSLDISSLLYLDTDDVSISQLALDIAGNCPEDLQRRYPLSMLRLTWALKIAGKSFEFQELLHKIDGFIDTDGLLRGEWILLSCYEYFPHLDKMFPLVNKAARYFGKTCSRVILPDAPWAFGDYFQLSVFHHQAGKAEQEALDLERFIAVYARLTNGHGSGADSLFKAELSHLRGETSDTEILAYKSLYLAESNKQDIIRLGAAMMLAYCAIQKADARSWQEAIDTMERAASQADKNIELSRVSLEMVHGMFLAELGVAERIADWLKDNAAFVQLPYPLNINALYTHCLYLIQKGKFTQLIGELEAASNIPSKSLFSDFVYLIHLAVGYAAIGENTTAASLLERAAEIAVPDGLLLHFASFS